MPLTLITGPVRAGKSRFAASLAASAGDVCYVATAKRDASDPEWTARLERHERDRPAEWTVIETATWSQGEMEALLIGAPATRTFIVDSLGGWLDALLHRRAAGLADDYVAVEADVEKAAEGFATALLTARTRVLAVGEEVGWDVVPAAPSARLFRDVLGRLQQRLATQADEAFLVVCGYAVDLRAAGRAIE